MEAKLISLNETPDILLNRPIVLIGRHEECDVVVDSKKVSRQHCCIANLQNYLVVRDLGSTNGIRVNGKRNDESKLYTGDELTIGNLNYRVASAGEPPPDRQPAEEVTDSQLEKEDQPVALADHQDQPIPQAGQEDHLQTVRGSDADGNEVPDDNSTVKQIDSESWLKIPDEVHLTPDSEDDIPI